MTPIAPHAHCQRRQSAPHAPYARLLRATVASVIMLVALPALAANAASMPVRIAYVGTQGSDAHDGARQGAEEANAQGQFLGLSYELASVPDIAAALALQPVAVVVDVPGADLPAVAAQASGIAVLNVTAEDDVLREHCIANLFHTIPSRAMRADAVRQWQRLKPEATVTAQAWHADFEKYAAAQLNKRYSEEFGRAMTDQAWAAWAAVKLLSDTIARLQSADPSTIIDSLQTDLAFDGQKGVDMSFRLGGQLRQPLLLVEGGSIVGEAPVRGVVDQEDLDSLGMSHCSK